MGSSRRTRHQSNLPIWATIAVAVLAVIVQLTRTGLDILLLAFALLLLLAFERTIGDWLGEVIGSSFAGIASAALLGGVMWYVVMHVGSAQTAQFFASAERNGYRSAYYHPVSSPVATAGPVAMGGGGAAAPVSTVGTATSSGGTSSGGTSSAGSRSEPQRDDARRPPDPPPTPPPASEQLASSVSIAADPSTVAPAHRSIIRARVSAQGGPVKGGRVEFTVNGMGIGAPSLSSAGTAQASFASHIPGTYQVQARFSGTSDVAPSTSDVVTLTIARR